MFGNNEKGLQVPDQITESSLREHLKEAAAVLTRTAGDATATSRAVDDLSGKLQGLLEAQARPSARNVENTTDREMMHRYTDETGRLHLQSTKRRLQFAGKSAEIFQPGLLDDKTICTDWQQDLQKAVERRSLVRLVAKNNATPRTDAEILQILHRAPTGIRGQIEKAITDTAGSGAEWIPDGTFPSIYEEFQTPNAVAALFGTIDMPNATMLQPSLTTGVRPYKRNAISSDDPTNYTGSTPVTSETTITVSNWAVRVVYDEMDAEDAVVAMEPLVRRLVVDALNDGYEDTMINGDTAASHQDDIANWNIRSRWGSSGLGGAADHRRIFLGLRALAADRSQTVDMGSAQTVTGLMSELVGGMGERAASQLAIIVSPEVFYQKLLADSNVLTLDKLGNAATLLSGQLASVFGHPIIVSRYLSADLAATGLYTGSGALSGAIAVDRSAFFHYQRRGSLVELERDIKTGGTHVVATLRRCFKTVSGANEAVVRFGYNWLS
jgi:hypothetical protein